MSTATKIGHGAAKVLGIKLNYREYGAQPPSEDKLTRGESVFSVSSADAYVEKEPSVLEWFEEYTPTLRGVGRYIYSLFPFVHWIHRYNLQWLYGDLIAGMLAAHDKLAPC